ncbi:30S ribosomal protein S9 [Cardinium endosymbiont of Culicoides punctatus]|uniref:30S ribosomal protein S9 n=1 Tax=Cardinium endosymbiont of Culicoides punctatus TaxID=2304601 RepID=UPI001058FE70|nr:30S ribosomal protein S9 [Cardinium endosymbiont of Culicoides punctatus]TDG93282.1 30S ribosomal protein S9 [Cardinium endosymbiont of Culicoides punctatus]
METINAVGRRKTAIARVYLIKGTGEIKVNRRSLLDYFPVEEISLIVKQPLEKLQILDKYDLNINVAGGGLRGQAEAIRLGVARALCKLDLENNRPLLKKEGFLTRDARVVERKKYGRKKARKRFQFTKR